MFIYAETLSAYYQVVFRGSRLEHERMYYTFSLGEKKNYRQQEFFFSPDDPSLPKSSQAGLERMLMLEMEEYQLNEKKMTISKERLDRFGTLFDRILDVSYFLQFYAMAIPYPYPSVQPRLFTARLLKGERMVSGEYWYTTFYPVRTVRAWTEQDAARMLFLDYFLRQSRFLWDVLVDGVMFLEEDRRHPGRFISIAPKRDRYESDIEPARDLTLLTDLASYCVEARVIEHQEAPLLRWDR